MRIKHVIGIAFTCMMFIFSCQAQSSTESHAGKNKQEQKIKPRHLTKAEFLSKVATMRKRPTSGSTWARSLALSIFTLHGAGLAESWLRYWRRLPENMPGKSMSIK